MHPSDGEPPHPARTGRDVRWRGAVAVLNAVRREPGVTRAEVPRRLGVSSGSATDITARLRELCLLAETPVAPSGRGRPTTSLHAHPEGPLVVAVDIQPAGWRMATVDVTGEFDVAAEGRVYRSGERTVADLTAAVGALRDRLGSRIRAVGVSVASTVRDGRAVEAASLGWQSVDLSGVSGDLPIVVGNDATLAGLFEARRGAAAGARSAVHVMVGAAGLGGVQIERGTAVVGAGGAAGEFGHMPFGERTVVCSCGARGCWGATLRASTLAAMLGEKQPDDDAAYVLEVLGRDDERARDAAGVFADRLGAGVAGLVNALDPDVVTLGGLAVAIRAADAARFSQAFEQGLMSLHRTDPPPVLDATFAEDGPLRGAAEAALDLVVTEAGLAAWAADRA